MPRSVYVIAVRSTPEGSKSFWTKVGVAHDNQDGSITIQLDALPLSGTLQIRDDAGRGRAPVPQPVMVRPNRDEDVSPFVGDDTAF